MIVQVGGQRVILATSHLESPVPPQQFTKERQEQCAEVAASSCAVTGLHFEPYALSEQAMPVWAGCACGHTSRQGWLTRG